MTPVIFYDPQDTQSTAMEAVDELRSRVAIPKVVGIKTSGSEMSDQTTGYEDVVPRLNLGDFDPITRTIPVYSTVGVRWPASIARELLYFGRHHQGTPMDERKRRLMQYQLDGIVIATRTYHHMWFNSFEKMWVPG